MMNSIHLEELPYQPDSCELFDKIRGLPGAVLLDSAWPYSRAGRFDILSACPRDSFTLSSLNTTSYESILKYFDTLDMAHTTLCKGLVAPAEELPFCGGLIGCLDYAAGNPLQHLEPESGSVLRSNLYNWALVQDHLRQRCLFVALPDLELSQRKHLLDLLREPLQRSAGDDVPFRLTEDFASNLDRQQYRTAFQRIQHYIQSGDCYQVNLARRFSGRCEGDPWHAYRKLRAVAAAPFSAYLDWDDRQLMSLSPERFLKVSGQRVETRPIKGTRPRHADAAADALAAEELLASRKDRAENLMIVDLLRNDIGRNCQPGSIQVDRLFDLESFATVHHLVSTISGELRPDRTAFDLLRDSFPGGSITGAPKRRAMQIIAELEPDSRQAYCGSVFYVSANGRMDSNIAIRTLQCNAGELLCWGGGGIVADSQWEQEYQETWDKIGRLLECLRQPPAG